MKKLIVIATMVIVMMTTVNANAAFTLVPHYHPSHYETVDEAALGLYDWMIETGFMFDYENYYLVEETTFYNEPVFVLYSMEGEYSGVLHAREEGFVEASDRLNLIINEILLGLNEY